MKRLLAGWSRWELAFLALTVLSIVPLWLVRHPPIQDLPQHLAAMRVLHDYHDPELGFARYFERSLGTTQYLAYYLVVDLLAYPFGVVLANKIVLSACLVGTPYALRSLLRALERDQAGAVLALPLTYNAHLILGFFNFLAAIPLLFWGLALAVQQRRLPERRRELWLGAVCLVAFYTHVVPAALLLLGAALILIRREPRPALRALAPLAPTLLAAAIWSWTTPAGRAVARASGAESARVAPRYETWGEALRRFPDWLTDVLHTPDDERLLVLLLLLLLAVLLFGSIVPRPREREPESTRNTLVVALLCLLCALAYFVTPSSYDWIWPINARFPLLALLLIIAVLPQLIEPARRVAVAAAALLGLWSFVLAGDAFRSFERTELAGFERVSAAVPPGSRVAGLIWDRGSRYVKFSPLLHAAALLQAERGGAVMFSFADFPHSPIRFRPERRPPPVPPRWEWLPQNVDPDRQLGWFDYVLVRGGPGRIERARRFRRIASAGAWALYRRVDAAAQPPM